MWGDEHMDLFKRRDGMGEETDGWLFDPGARERERQDKIAKRRKEYADFAKDFLTSHADVVESWPTYESSDGLIRCGRIECDQAIDDDGSEAAIRRHLLISHRTEMGVEESGIVGENQALGSRRKRRSNSRGGSPRNRLQN